MKNRSVFIGNSDRFLSYGFDYSFTKRDGMLKTSGSNSPYNST